MRLLGDSEPDGAGWENTIMFCFRNFLTRSNWPWRFSCLAVIVSLAGWCGSSALFAQERNADRPTTAEEVRALRALVTELEARDARIEAELHEMKTQLEAQRGRDPAPEAVSSIARDEAATGIAAKAAGGPHAIEDALQESTLQSNATNTNSGADLSQDDRRLLDVLKGNTINFAFDGYYAYNFNHPYGRVNLLRAYDVLSNTFSLNQASVIFEHAPDPAAGHRFGMRLDLQFGQATETLQGNPANEPRPEIYRNIFQAYGTYVLPIGRGLTVDFGKWASSLGFENNYTKDQMNYSRSYWFNFLPFYHMGVRANYQFNDKFGLNYWVINGTDQTEPTNAFKDQFVGLALTPRKTINWNVNYYLGQEHPDVAQVANPGPVPVQPGLGFVPIRPAPDGRLHIVDSYVSWQTTTKLTFALEGDYVIERLWRHAAPGRSSAPTEVWGGATYAHYQWTPRVAVGVRAEYLSDRQGMFSGVSQSLKETTATLDYKIAEGFVMRYEWRRDFSNQPYFQTDTFLGRSPQQNTATLGLVWWFGRKEGVW